MNPILQALASGYTIDQVLSFAMRAFPALGSKINQAKKSGYSIQQIVDFLSRTTEGGPVDKRLSQSEIHALNTRKQSEMTKDFLTGGLKLAGSIAGAQALRKSVPGLIKGMQSLSQTPSQPIPGDQPPTPNPAQQVQAIAQAPVQQAMQTGDKISQVPQIAQQQIPKQIDSESIINQMGLTDRIRNLAKAGNTPEGVAAALSISMSPGQKKWLSDQVKQGASPELEDLVSDFMGKIPAEEKSQQKIARGSTVITPDGDIATIEDLPGKTAKVDVDGKKQVLDTEDLIPEPENKDEILDLYEKLIASIPEEHRSSMLNWVGYDTDRNLLQVKFHNGVSHTYGNIPAEFADKLKESAFLAKTAGQNYYGAWEKGESSRGAGVAALIRELQKAYGGKGKEYTGKFREIYSFLGIPEQKLKEKLKREQEEKKKKRRKGNP